jgi:hypothetical protein
MDKVVELDINRPRIRISGIPKAGDHIPFWFIEKLIGLTLPIESLVQGRDCYFRKRILSFRVPTKAVYNALLRKSKVAASFLINTPSLWSLPCFEFNTECCEFIGDFRELKCKVISAQN